MARLRARVQAEHHARRPRRPLRRAGNALAALIEAATGIGLHTVEPTGRRSCACQSLRAELNKRGWWWAWTHRQQICTHLAAAAAARGIAVNPTLPSLLLEAFRQASGRNPPVRTYPNRHPPTWGAAPQEPGTLRHPIRNDL